MGLFEKFDPREIRQRLGLNQDQFWTKIGVTQSGGSRYESGREMPKPVRELLRLVHVEQIDLSKVKKEDFEVLEYLKNDQPELYKKLRRAVRAAQGLDKVEEAPVWFPGGCAEKLLFRARLCYNACLFGA
jgi:transcriptional regulator with XRE-family HTH domain